MSRFSFFYLFPSFFLAPVIIWFLLSFFSPLFIFFHVTQQRISSPKLVARSHCHSHRQKIPPLRISLIPAGELFMINELGSPGQGYCDVGRWANDLFSYWDRFKKAAK